ncbi:hypothetical protein GCM10025781_14500 [Kocuria gwangalliensis]|uniref:Uncharacterized protein n=1 Tax=Kocuria gwangalliensis TaxID=501592 RepID=A0ABP8WY62_9MICC
MDVIAHVLDQLDQVDPAIGGGLLVHAHVDHEPASFGGLLVRYGMAFQAGILGLVAGEGAQSAIFLDGPCHAMRSARTHRRLRGIQSMPLRNVDVARCA